MKIMGKIVVLPFPYIAQLIVLFQTPNFWIILIIFPFKALHFEPMHVYNYTCILTVFSKIAFVSSYMSVLKLYS